MQLDSLKRKIALVTGSTSGIGEETAKQLLMNGAIVIINYSKDDEKADSVKTELKKFGTVECIKADISDERQVIDMFGIIEKKFNRLDYLVNNAGISIDDFIENISLKDFKKVLDVNLTGKFNCMKNAIPLLKKSQTPSIVNVASRLGTKAMEESCSYCCAEAGIIMLTKVGAVELSSHGIRVNTVSPGMTMTPMIKKFYSPEEIKATEKKNPMGRLGETKDIANTILFLLSDEAGYINGENINVNGGTLLV